MFWLNLAISFLMELFLRINDHHGILWFYLVKYFFFPYFLLSEYFDQFRMHYFIFIDPNINKEFQGIHWLKDFGFILQKTENVISKSPLMGCFFNYFTFLCFVSNWHFLMRFYSIYESKILVIYDLLVIPYIRCSRNFE